MRAARHPGLRAALRQGPAKKPPGLRAKLRALLTETRTEQTIDRDPGGPHGDYWALRVSPYLFTFRVYPDIDTTLSRGDLLSIGALLSVPGRIHTHCLIQRLQEYGTMTQTTRQIDYLSSLTASSSLQQLRAQGSMTLMELDCSAEGSCENRSAQLSIESTRLLILFKASPHKTSCTSTEY